MPGRSFSSGSYKYGFNGKEKDDESGWQDYGERMYNPKLGRFFSVDPFYQKYPYLSTYQFSSNNPIFMVDVDGLEGTKYYSAVTKGETSASLKSKYDIVLKTTDYKGTKNRVALILGKATYDQNTNRVTSITEYYFVPSLNGYYNVNGQEYESKKTSKGAKEKVNSFLKTSSSAYADSKIQEELYGEGKSVEILEVHGIIEEVFASFEYKVLSSKESYMADMNDPNYNKDAAMKNINETLVTQEKNKKQVALNFAMKELEKQLEKTKIMLEDYNKKMEEKKSTITPTQIVPKKEDWWQGAQEQIHDFVPEFLY